MLLLILSLVVVAVLAAAAAAAAAEAEAEAVVAVPTICLQCSPVIRGLGQGRCKISSTVGPRRRLQATRRQASKKSSPKRTGLLWNIARQTEAR